MLAISNNNNKFAAFLLIASILQGLIWVIIIPPFQDPDEPAHFASVQHLCENGSVRPPGTSHQYSRELHKSMDLLKLHEIKFNSTSTFYFSKEEEKANLAKINEIPHSERNEPSGDFNPAGHYPPAYYLLGSLGYLAFYDSNIIDRVGGVRLISVLITSLSIMVTYLMARVFFEEDIVSVRSASCLMLFHPMYAYVGSCVNCDSMLCFVSTFYLLLQVIMVKKGVSWRLQAGICICIAIGLLTKPTFAALIPVWFLAFFISCRRNATAKKQVLSHLLFIFTILITTVVLYSKLGKEHLQIYLNAIEMGQNDQSLSFLQYMEITFLNLIRPWSTMGKRILTSYWANFGWKDSPFQFFGIYLFALGITIIAVILVITRIRKSTIPWYSEQNGLISFTLLCIGLFSLGIIIIGYSIAHQAWESGNLQGRYFFPTLSLHMVLLTAGLIHPIKSQRAKGMMAFLTVGALFVWHVASFAIVLKRFYL
ncbi:MAG: DUF2142 domain-containing protein [Planctomycetota bacterium]